MKKIFFLFAVLIFSFNSYANNYKTYNKKLEFCKDKFEKMKEDEWQKYKSDFDSSGVQQTDIQRDLTYKEIDCYTNVANNFIDIYYTHSNKEMKKDLQNYLKNMYTIGNNMYISHNRCYEKYCGLQAYSSYVKMTAVQVFNMVFEIINGMDIVERDVSEQKKQELKK